MTEFGGTTHFEMFKTACAFLKKKSDCVLFVPYGRYSFSTPDAKKLQHDIMNGISVLDDFHFSRGIVISDTENVKIDGNGSCLVTDGFMQTLYISRCKNLEISNFRFDCARKPYSIGSVTNVTDYHDYTSALVTLDQSNPINPETPINKIELTDLVFSRTPEIFDCEIIDNFHLTFKLKGMWDVLGAKCNVTHIGNLLPVIRIENCENVTLRNIIFCTEHCDTVSTENVSGLVLENVNK